MRKKKILLVDDDLALASLAKRELGKSGYEVLVAHDEAQAIQLAEATHWAKADRFDMFILDLDLEKDVKGDRSGQGLLDTLEPKSTPRIIWSGYGEKDGTVVRDVFDRSKGRVRARGYVFKEDQKIKPLIDRVDDELYEDPTKLWIRRIGILGVVFLALFGISRIWASGVLSQQLNNDMVTGVLSNFVAVALLFIIQRYSK